MNFDDCAKAVEVSLKWARNNGIESSEIQSLAWLEVPYFRVRIVCDCYEISELDADSRAILNLFADSFGGLAEIADLLSLSFSYVSSLANQLEAQGLIRLESESASLTEEGIRTLSDSLRRTKTSKEVTLLVDRIAGVPVNARALKPSAQMQNSLLPILRTFEQSELNTLDFRNAVARKLSRRFEMIGFRDVATESMFSRVIQLKVRDGVHGQPEERYLYESIEETEFAQRYSEYFARARGAIQSSASTEEFDRTVRKVLQQIGVSIGTSVEVTIGRPVVDLTKQKMSSGLDAYQALIQTFRGPDEKVLIDLIRALTTDQEKKLKGGLVHAQKHNLPGPGPIHVAGHQRLGMSHGEHGTMLITPKKVVISTIDLVGMSRGAVVSPHAFLPLTVELPLSENLVPRYSR